jgi:ADP-ribose pyrophosphatase
VQGLFDYLREELLTSRVVFQGRLLTIRVDEVRLADGVTCTREVIAHPGAVAMVPLLDADHVLLVRQWRHPAGRALLEIPAGTLAAGEEPRACATRELMEEIAYRPRRLTPLCTMFLAPGYSSEQLHVFLAEDLIPETRAQDEDERIDLVTVSWDDVAGLLRSGEIADAKTISGLLLAREHLG